MPAASLVQAAAGSSDFRARLSDDVETHLFRIAQEALTNVARHSGASSVRIDLHEVQNRLRLALEDDGRGLDTGTRSREPQPSLGMVGMRARANEIGGVLRLSRPPGGGLNVEVDVPLPRPLDLSRDQQP